MQLKKQLKKHLKHTIISTVILLLIMFVILTHINTKQFPYDNIRYAYSAIFQGFSALLALTITSVLITLQNIHSQTFKVEEGIIRLLNFRFETHVPGTLDQIEKDIETKEFQIAFKSHLLNQVTDSNTQSNYIMRNTINEIQQKIYFLNAMMKKEKELELMFKISLCTISSVLLYSLVALIIIPTKLESIEIVQIGILIIALVLVSTSLMVLIKILIDILDIWKFKPELRQTEIFSQFKIE